LNTTPTGPRQAGGPLTLTITPIGVVCGGRVEATKDGWGGNRSRLELDASRFSADCLLGLDALSHIEVVFYFHVDDDEPIETGARHPRGRLDWPRVGIFAQRGRMRPNRLGVSVCRVVGVDVDGLAIEVEGLDAVDDTPLIDIKPVWSGYLPRGALREPAWAQELMAGYW
jgi:tRNA (adenine37-N6)-methyltransferase